jgi:hypothetical protein
MTDSLVEQRRGERGGTVAAPKTFANDNGRSEHLRRGTSLDVPKLQKTGTNGFNGFGNTGYRNAMPALDQSVIEHRRVRARPAALVAPTHAQLNICPARLHTGTAGPRGAGRSIRVSMPTDGQTGRSNVLRVGSAKPNAARVPHCSSNSASSASSPSSPMVAASISGGRVNGACSRCCCCSAIEPSRPRRWPTSCGPTTSR